MTGQLMVCYQDGATRMIDNEYESIKRAMLGATITMVGLPREHAFFIDDNGMLDKLKINIPASLMWGGVLYGPVVLCGPPDHEGETQPPHTDVLEALKSVASMWRRVIADALKKGQHILTEADPDVLPPPELIALTEDEFNEWMAGRWFPDV